MPSYLTIVCKLFFLQCITFWHILNVATADKNYTMSHPSQTSNPLVATICICKQTLVCVSGGGSSKRSGVNFRIYYLTEKTIQMDLLTLFFNLLAGPCSCAVDSMHKYTEYWLNTNNPPIPSDECHTYSDTGSISQIKISQGSCHSLLSADSVTGDQLDCMNMRGVSREQVLTTWAT